MSKKIEAKITCPSCNHQFDYTLFRSIWGEYPDNRELVMNDKINVAECPSCGVSTKLVFPFIYTNAKQHFAVWWEPEYDPQIDKDSASYSIMMGEGNYLAKAPRVRDWKEFKETILAFERGELKGKPAVFERGELKGKPGTKSPGILGQKEEFLKDFKKKNKKQKSGCSGMVAILITGAGGFGYTVFQTIL